MADRDKSPPDRGHPMPRRATPEKSLTLQNHGMHREASVKLTPDPQVSPVTQLSQRNSSDESHDTDGQKWFDRSNKKPETRFDGTHMDVDPPFFQKESDSSNEENQVAAGSKPLYPFVPRGVAPLSIGPRPPATQSSQTDDFRSVIDDLTIENKRLKDELRRFKQFGSGLMSKEKLFEIKMHGLPRRKRRELEATLRDFAASLGDGSTDASPSRKRTSKHGSAGRGSSTSNSKHPSSSTNSRPADSAYASASTGPSSAAPYSSTASLGRPSVGRSRSSEQKVDAYLKGIPEGMYPQRLMMSEREKKKWVVKRLEHLFTGKLASVQLMPGVERHSSDFTILPPLLEAAREAQMQPPDIGKKQLTRDRSANDSIGEQTESRDTGTGSGSGSGSGGRSGNNDSSPNDQPPKDQRPTRIRDLDPERAQIPSDNMDYVRHISGLGEDSTAPRVFRSNDVTMDAEGWIYLNLLCNMAQLHIMNVTPAFVRQAVTEKSMRFQLSPDGQKIRWRGGTEGTKFSGDSSADNSKQSPATDESEASNENGQRKRRKLDEGPGANQSKLGFKSYNSSTGNFHYKPIFLRRDSSQETSLDETESQVSAVGSKPQNNSRGSLSGTASSGRKRRRVDGAIVYYSGAPFCTDLSGDTGDVSPTTYMISTGQEQSSAMGSSGLLDGGRANSSRTWSGSTLPFRPLIDGPSALLEQSSSAGSEPDLVMDDTDSSEELDFDFPWCDEPGKVEKKTLEPLLEPCGLGGVTPDDHFAVFAITRHPCNVRFDNDDYDTTEAIVTRLATMSTASPQPVGLSHPTAPIVEFELVSAKIRRLKPMPLPQPAMFYPPFSTSSESDYDSGADSAAEADDEIMYESPLSVPKRANRSKSNVNTYPEGADLSSNDEEDDAEDDNGYEASVGSSVSPRTRNANKKRRQKSLSFSVSVSASNQESGKSVEAVRAGSSLATAGDVGSGYRTQSQDEDA